MAYENRVRIVLAIEGKDARQELDSTAKQLEGFAESGTRSLGKLKDGFGDLETRGVSSLSASLRELSDDEGNWSENLENRSRLREIHYLRAYSLTEQELSFRRDSLRREYEDLQNILDESHSLRQEYSEQAVTLTRDELDEKLRSAATFSDYFQARLRSDSDAYGNELDTRRKLWDDTYSLMQRTAEGFSRNVSQNLSTMLFDMMTGRMQGLESYWNSLWTSMLKTMTDTIAQMAVNWAASALIEWGAGLVDTLLTYHSGAVNIKDDELIAKLQEGEMIIPKDQAETIRTAMAQGGISQGDYFNSVSKAVQLGTQRDFGFSTITDPQAKGIIGGKAVSSVLGGLAVGINNYSQVMGMAQALQSSGFNIDMGRAQNYAADMAVSGALSAAFTGFVGGIIGDLGAFALGVYDYSKPAQVVNAALAAITGFSIPGVLAAALSPLTALGISLVADTFDLRENETLRDHLEDTYGFITGRQAYQALSAYTSELGMDLANTTMTEEGPVVTVKETYGLFMDYPIDKLLDNIREQTTLSLPQQVAKMAYNYGYDYTSSVWAGDDQASKEALAGIVADDPGFFGYDSRRAAEETLGLEPGSLDPSEDSDTSDAYGDSDSEGADVSGGDSDGGDAGDGSGGGPGDAGDAGTRALGGSVWSGQPYLVGEEGPELFVPNTSGRIIARHDASGYLAGQPPALNLTVQIVSQDGRIIEEKLFEALRTASENGLAVVHSKGVYCI